MVFHDKEYFKNLMDNLVGWAMVAMSACVLFTLVFLPAVMAFLVDWRFSLVYAAYLLLSLIASIIKSKGGDNA